MKFDEIAKESTTHKCRRCGSCCRNFAYIPLSQEDVKTLEDFTGLTAEEFTDSIDDTGEKRFLRFKENGDCIFLDMIEGAYSCSVYEARSVMCRDYPSTDIQRDTCRACSSSSGAIADLPVGTAKKGFAIMTIPTKLIGAAGEHYVAYKLSSFGMSVALTRDGSDVIDLMAGDIFQGTATPVQVKTARKARKGKYWEWSVGRKPLTLKDSNLVYVFIDLMEGSKEDRPPTVFIVPVADVAQQAIDAGFVENPDWKTFYFKIHDEHSPAYLENWSLITKRSNG